MNSSGTMLFLVVIVIAVVGLVMWAFVGSRKRDEDDDDVRMISGAASKARNVRSSMEEGGGPLREPGFGAYARSSKADDLPASSSDEVRRPSRGRLHESLTRRDEDERGKAMLAGSAFATIKEDAGSMGSVADDVDPEATLVSASLAPVQEEATHADAGGRNGVTAAITDEAGQSTQVVESAVRPESVESAVRPEPAESAVRPEHAEPAPIANAAEAVEPVEVVRPARSAEVAEYVRPAGVAGFCPTCGTPFRKTDAFCGECGRSLAGVHACSEQR